MLFVQNRILFPTNTGGRIRTLNILRHLARWHDVTYLCNIEPKDKAHLHEMQSLGVRLEVVPWQGTTSDQWKFYWDLAWNTFSSLPFSVAKDFNTKLRARASQLLTEEAFDLTVCDFVQMAPVVVGLPCRASVLFQHNVEAQIFQRHATTDQGWLRRRLMSSQWRKMRRFEMEAGRKFDAVIAVSQQDRKVFQREYGWRHVAVIDTAVDVDHFTPQPEAEPDHRVVFVASMDWLPNQDGAAHFVTEIWPAIQRACPEASFRIVGRNPSRRVQDLAEVEGVEVLGTVPDVRPYLAEAAVVVVPLLVGGGTRIKIFEAMAMGKPVVSTSLGAEGLKVIDQQHILLADTPKDFGQAVIRLLADRQEQRRVGEAARALVCEQFAAEPVARQFEQVCFNVIS